MSVFAHSTGNEAMVVGDGEWDSLDGRVGNWEKDQAWGKGTLGGSAWKEPRVRYPPWAEGLTDF